MFLPLVLQIEAAALRSTILSYACAPTATRSYLPVTTVCVHFFSSFFLEISVFPSIFVPFISVFSVFGEYVVRFFPLSGVVFYLEIMGWIFYISLCVESTFLQWLSQ